MKKIILSLLALVGVANLAVAQSQKVCYIYSQNVLKALPEYQEAVNILEQKTSEARAMSDELFEKAKVIFSEFQQYQDRMSPAQYERYKEMVIEAEERANNYEEQMFGKDGEIAKLQKSLLEPIEKRLIEVVNQFAEEGGYDMVYDLSVVKVSIYQSPKLDMTSEITRRMGIK